MISNSPEETEAIGKGLARQLRAGDILWLNGDLGSGKTAFTRGLARGMGCNPELVSSPTFSLVHEYPGKELWIFHFDLYRLSCIEELLDIGWDEYLQRSGICAVEWSQRLDERSKGYDIIFTSTGKASRQIKIYNPEGNEVIVCS
ncbi:MAG: tRNA (adenosine(37)-N6)-threonylcarbamoyltransferase complex ATPase subunit type 1 TsaE [Oscillospiraceae bacterium]|nr:tRNA (adenosine(37)-N6)-threonylcarbamoyltransferase complex ATPase subunit type 1 TsaE [Oscillospiraceae bacterium]